MTVSNVLLWEVHPIMVIHHEQCMTQLAGKETIFNKLIKIIELKFISTTCRLLLQISHSPAYKHTSKVISNHTKNFNEYIYLAPYSV